MNITEVKEILEELNKLSQEKYNANFNNLCSLRQRTIKELYIIGGK